MPERHAQSLKEGDAIQIDGVSGVTVGKLERIYPQIENGRVVADVSVQGLSDAFVDARVLVRLPVAKRSALLVPQSAVIIRSGLDFIGVTADESIALRAVVLGEVHAIDTTPMVEVLTGLQPGDGVETDAAKVAAAADSLTVEGAAHE